MNFHWPFFHKPQAAEVAALRDRLIAAETKVVLLLDIVEHPRRGREVRKDARRYRDKLEETTAKLQSEIAAQRFKRLEPVLFRGMGKGTP